MPNKDIHFDRNLVVNGIPLTILAYSAYPSYTANESSSLRIVPPPWSESDLKVSEEDSFCSLYFSFASANETPVVERTLLAIKEKKTTILIISNSLPSPPT